MKIHRFYVGARLNPDIQHFGEERCWIQDKTMMHRIIRVLRIQQNETIELFDETLSVLYEVTEFKDNEVSLHRKTEAVRREIHGTLLAWSLVRPSLNEFILQKGTEIGISRFVPLVTKRTENKQFDSFRAQKIVIEASEQSGRSSLPEISEPIDYETILKQFLPEYRLFLCHPGSDGDIEEKVDKLGILIGPEGGWTSEELELATEHGVKTIGLGEFVLRAETAAIIGSAKIVRGLL